jgi:acyl-CoA thioesterase FadM/phosphopantetheinyl transferase
MDIPDNVYGIATVFEKAGNQYFSSVSISNGSGRLLERLEGYTLQVLEHHEHNPTAEEIAEPGKRDEEILRNELLARAKELDLEVPEITAEHVAGIHQLPRDERHRHEKPLMERTVALAQPGTGGKVTIDWMKSGKPVIKGAYAEQVDISLAHDDDTIVCVAGNAPQGCDVAFISPRSFEQWVSLLGNSRMSLLQELCNGSDSLDQAGTRIWAAVETFQKALNQKNITLSIHRHSHDTVVFNEATAGNQLQVVTFPIRFTRPPERMIAITVRANGIAATECPESQETPGKPDVLPATSAVSDELARKLNFDLSTYNLELITGPQNRPASLVRYPVTFREASNRSRTLHFSRYFDWIGTLRELTLNPVMDRVVELFSSGKWGMVTNHTETRIFDEAHTGDIIEGCLWLEKLSGSENSTLHLCFEWHKITENNVRSLIALSTMSSTWVEVHDGGKLEIKPLPGFFKEYVNKLLPQPVDRHITNGREPAGTFTPESFRQAIHTPADLGREVYREPAGPVRNSSFLAEMTLDTSLEDANLVGNVYFANYYVWQGRIRDHYFHDLVTAVPSGMEPYGELRCIFSRVDHTAEAMPFDRIKVKMYLTAVFERGVRLYFEYYRVSGDTHTKLAYGEHEALWIIPDTESNWIPAPLPEQFRKHLLR